MARARCPRTTRCSPVAALDSASRRVIATVMWSSLLVDAIRYPSNPISLFSRDHAAAEILNDSAAALLISRNSYTYTHPTVTVSRVLFVSLRPNRPTYRMSHAVVFPLTALVINSDAIVPLVTLIYTVLAEGTRPVDRFLSDLRP